MANKTETSSKNIKPRTNLNHNIYIFFFSGEDDKHLWKLFVKYIQVKLFLTTRTKRADLQQICNRSVLIKTDQLQTTLSSAESVFSLLQTLSLNTLRDVNTVDAKQTNNRSADDLQHLQMIYNTLKSKTRYYR